MRRLASGDGRRVLRRWALRVLLGSLAASAVMGVVAVAQDELGDTEGNLLLTALSVLGTSAIALSCGLAWERGKLWALPPAGIALGIAGFAFVLALIWGGDPNDDRVWQAFGTEITLAVSATHASLVAVFAPRGRGRGAAWAAYALNVLVASGTLWAIWGPPDGDAFWRAYVGVLVVGIAVTLAVPVLRRMEGAGAGAGEEGARFCPRCGVRLEEAGAESCAGCGARFRVRWGRTEG